MQRIIKLTNGDVINLIYQNGYYDTIIIDRVFCINGKLSQVISFSMSNMFVFKAEFIDESNHSNVIDFTFEQNDPLYKHLSFLLGDDDEIIMYDRNIDDKNGNSIIISRDNININVTFKGESKYILGQFHVRLNDICTNYSEKKENGKNDIKERLLNFFKGMQNEFLISNLDDEEDYKKR